MLYLLVIVDAKCVIIPHAGPSSSVMEGVCKKTGVSDQQLNQEIPESDIILIAEKFSNLLSRAQLRYRQYSKSKY